MNWEAVIAPAFCSRLCLSLLHSFWFIALLAVATRVVDYALRRRSVQTRYAVYTIGLCVCLGVLPVIFSMVGGPAVPLARQRVSFEPDHGGELVPFGHSQIISRPTRALPPEAVVSQPTPNEAAPRASSNALAVWSRWSPWIAGIYVVGVLAMLARLVRGIGASHRLFRHAEIIHEGPLVDLVQSVATRWSMRVAPTLARAQEIVVPKVIGLVQPTILLPMSAVTGLSNDELSMIIAHEMAHVRRYDMWVNLLQRLAETLLFFNPAMWYISRRISTLREYCCDEMACEAIAGTRPQPRVCYASALLRVAELSRENNSPQTSAGKHSELATLAASGRSPSELRRRLAHLFGEPIREPFFMSHWGVLVLIAILSVWLFSPVSRPSAAESTDHGAETEAAAESKKSTNATVESQGHGKKKENPTQKRRGDKPKASAGFRRMQVTAVRASDKQPIPDLKFDVRFWRDGKQHQASYATNKKGVVELDLPTNRNLYWIRIEAHPKGLVPITLGWNSRNRRVFSPSSETTLRFESGVTIGGIVKDQMGAPVRGAKVELHAGARPEYPQLAVWNSHKTVSDKNGRWRWDVAPADLENLTLSITHPDYANKPVSRPLKSVAALDAFMLLEAEFELIEGFSVSGRVTNKKGNPIAGARVAVGEKRQGSYIRFVKSRKDGSFAIKYSKAGPSVVTVEAKGYGPELRQVVVSPNLQMLKFAMKSPRVIRGRVVDPSGKPIAGAFAAAGAWRGHRSLSWRVKTDAQGRFVWKSAPHDAVLFDFGAYGYGANRFQLSPQDKEHVVTLLPEPAGNAQ